MNKHIFFFFLFFSFSAAYAQKSTLVWSLSGSDLEGKSYIVATVAIKDSTFLNYPSGLWKSLDKSKVFINSFSAEYEGEPFANFGQNLENIPSVEMKNYALSQQIPTQDYQSLEGGLVLRSTSKYKINEFAFHEAFLSADLKLLKSLFLEKEALTPAILQSIETDLNYTLVSDLVQISRTQRAFFPIDLIHFFGEKNIINLLVDRGYTVTPLFSKFYLENAKKIEAQKAALAAYQNQIQESQSVAKPQLPNSNTEDKPLNNTPVEAIQIEENSAKSVDLNLPIGILNLSQWSEYQFKDSLFSYLAPSRLKTKENERVYSTKSDDLVYQVEFLEKADGLEKSIERLMIRKGGQLTKNEPLELFGFPSAKVEFIYNENKISRHFLIQHLDQVIVCSVTGSHPKIFSQQASQFLNSIKLKPFVASSPNEVQASVNTEELNTWVYKSFNGFSASFPTEPEDVSTTTENGSNLMAYVIPRGKVDDNTYLYVSFKKQSADTFRLFNEAINQAAKESNSIIVERNVLPENRNYYASYVLKDALEQHYKIQYWYDGVTFYQFIVKGNKRSIVNQNVLNLFNSISIEKLF